MKIFTKKFAILAVFISTIAFAEQGCAWDESSDSESIDLDYDTTTSYEWTFHCPHCRTSYLVNIDNLNLTPIRGIHKCDNGWFLEGE